MQVVQEEVFGPVATVLPFRFEDEVIKRANNSLYGLSAGIFTKYAPIEKIGDIG